ncbi:hypothetical protein SISSUDRAFT_973178, partial [Sistotremastrum suecicum HHB10207 ss-3]
FNKNPDDLFGAPDSIITPDRKYLHVSNFSKEPIIVRKGTALGIAHKPQNYLDKFSKFSSEELDKFEKHANYVKSLAQSIDKASTKPEPPSSLSEPVTGGPKTNIPLDDPTPSSRLLQTIDFAPNLTPDQRQQLEDVVLRHQQAFGLDNRLGEYNANVTIKLKPDSKPISLPPFPTSPKNREV